MLIIREVIILPFCTTVVKGIINLMIHSKYLNVVVQPVLRYSEHNAITRSFGIFKPGRGKFDICLRNHSPKQITLPKWSAVGETVAVNIIPALLV